MKKKTVKLPSIFRKPVSLKAWEKKYLGKIYLKDDLEFLKRIAVTEGDTVQINAELVEKKDIARLKDLGKVIKANRKAVSFILLIIIVLIAAAAAVFTLFFKNPLIERFIENSLGSVFETEADISGVDLNILNGEFRADSLVIANPDNTMMNLAEIRGISASVDIAGLLKGRVLITEMGFSELLRNTPRDSAAVIPQSDSAPADSADADGSSGEGAFSEGGEGIAGSIKDAGSNIISKMSAGFQAVSGEIDAEAILDEQLDKLASIQAAGTAADEIKSDIEKWKDSADEWGSKLDEWSPKVKYLTSINKNSFSTAAKATESLKELNTIYNKSVSDYKEIETLTAEAGRQISELKEMSDSLIASVQDDYSYVESLIQLPKDQGLDWISSLIEDSLGLPISSYLEKINTGLEYYRRFKAITDREREEKPQRRNPRRLADPDADQPFFRLVSAYAAGVEDDFYYNAVLSNISSGDGKTQEVPTLELGWEMQNGAETLVRLSTEDMAFSTDRLALSSPIDLTGIGISSISGNAAVLSSAVYSGGNYSGSISLDSEDLAFKPVDENNIAYKLLLSSLDKVRPFAVEGGFSYSEAGGLDLSLTTGMDDVLGDTLKDLLDEGAGEAVTLLREELDKRLKAPLAEVDKYRAEIESYVSQLEDIKKDIGSYRQLADTKIKETEAQIKKIAEEKAKAEAQKQLDAAKDAATDAVKQGVGNLLNF